MRLSLTFGEIGWRCSSNPKGPSAPNAYHGDQSAGADTAAEAHPPLVVGVLAPPHEVLVAHVARPLVDHKAAALHPDGVAAAEVGVQVGAVVAALMAPALEVPVLVENYLFFVFKK